MTDILLQYSCEPIRVTHSIPDCCGMILRSDHGTIVHTGDWKIDENPVGGQNFDRGLFEKIGRLYYDCLKIISHAWWLNLSCFTSKERLFCGLIIQWRDLKSIQPFRTSIVPCAYWDFMWHSDCHCWLALSVQWRCFVSLDYKVIFFCRGLFFVQRAIKILKRRALSFKQEEHDTSVNSWPSIVISHLYWIIAILSLPYRKVLLCLNWPFPILLDCFSACLSHTTWNMCSTVQFEQIMEQQSRCSEETHSDRENFCLGGLLSIRQSCRAYWGDSNCSFACR